MSDKLLRRVHTLAHETFSKMPVYIGSRSKNTSLLMEEANFYAVLLSAQQLENYQQLKVVLDNEENLGKARADL